ncbi:YggT family protein [Gloeothece verrucosa]|uniref:YggT family protein n=1 Tax=Gloeothece verrucosa (strain PCC 7822) TaxID=497965 RepID=E0UGW9_GLOV7|nr:YggT family protein [Gloeothece verrucosa]ADN14450.1 hypothetical protein Cyan7822_2478 [Gloeothece verrucosa PCC 7822]
MNHPNHKQNAHETPSTGEYLVSSKTLELKEEQLRLTREQRRQAQLRFDLIIDKIINAIYFVVVTVEVMLGFRFVLHLAQANPQNLFASIVFGLSNPLAAPFANLFNPGNGNNLFDGGLVVGIVVYWMLGMMLIWLVGLLRR